MFIYTNKSVLMCDTQEKKFCDKLLYIPRFKENSKISIYNRRSCHFTW